MKTIRSLRARKPSIPFGPLWSRTSFQDCKPAAFSLSAARAPFSLLGGTRRAISPTRSFSPGRGKDWPAPPPPPPKGVAKGEPGAPPPPGTRPPSRRRAPNGRAALGPSASPHVAPPRASLSLAVARPSGPAPLLVAGHTALQPRVGSEVNGPE